jgi:hypothetical protein
VSNVSLVFNTKSNLLNQFFAFSGLEFLHTKCNMVHGDLSINNIVIYRAPLEHPPSKASTSKKGTTMPTNPNMNMRRNVYQQQGSVVPAPLTGLDESIPVVGTVIDYDYARLINTRMDKTSVRLSLELFCHHAQLFFSSSGNFTLYAT